MERKIKVLHVVNAIVSGGVEQMLINYFSADIFNDYELYIAYSKSPDASCLEKLKKCGFHPIRLQAEPCKKRVTYFNELYKIMKENKIDILHTHINQDNYIPLIAAYIAGVKVRISHSHGLAPETNSFFKKHIVRKAKRKLGIIFSTARMACSKKAGNYLFEKKDFNIIYNSIDLEKFYYNDNKRKHLRKELNLTDKKVIGYIARFDKGKNHLFLLDVFYEVQKKEKNAILVLIGTGNLENEMLEKIKNYNINEKVIIISPKENIYDYYQIMDLFLFPSDNEGLGMVAIESQVNNLFCIASIGVPEETKISNNIEYINLEKEKWIAEILEKIKIRSSIQNIDNNDFSKFNIKNQRLTLKKYYQKFYNEK